MASAEGRGGGRPRLSRWGRSPYETDAQLAAERAALGDLVEVVEPGAPAEIIVVTSKDPVGEALHPRLGPVRLVLTTTSGFEHLDLDLLRGLGVAAGRCPLARRDAVVESALGLLLDGLRAHGPLRAEAAAGRWARGGLHRLGMRRVSGAEIGVVGLGVIGRRMAEVLGALGARVLGHDPLGVPAGVEAVSLGEMFARSAAVTLHCRLDGGSTGLVGAAELAAARPGLVLVNTARGDVLDVDAALAALDAGRLGALGLDVFPIEPWPALAAAASRPRLCLLPHAAGYYDGLSDAILAELRAAITAWRAGLPLPAPVC
ncbi:MAG: hypothetical protein RL071_3510 [Pseudomonadota bacterium]